MNIAPSKSSIYQLTGEIPPSPAEQTGDASIRPNRHAVRAAEYRAIAAQARSSAETSGLAHVREKFTRSAQVWTEMAEADERRAHPVPAPR